MQILSSLEYAIKRKRFPELLPVLTLPFPHLFAFSSLVMRFLLRLREEVFHLALPVEEEKEQSDAACATDEIPYFSIHSHRLLRDANKLDADKYHEQGRNEADETVLLFQGEIDCYCPKSEDGECLVCPAEILPYHIESVFVLHLPYDKKNCANEHRD